MSFREVIFDRFFADIHAQRVSALRESHGGDADAGWRRLSERDRDLNPIKLDRQREIAVYLWTHNPVARRIIETMVEWIVGEGVSITADDEDTKALLESMWNHPVNRWDLKLPMRVRELFLMGEQAWPVFRNQFSGVLVMGGLDPSKIKEVVTDPDNVEAPIGVIQKAPVGHHERRLKTVLRGDELEILSPAAQRERESFTDGELFLFQVNKLSSQTRGSSELFVLADWIDAYEDLLFAMIQVEKNRANVLWDVELAGATDEEIQDRLKTIKPPKPLTVRVHNEKEKWTLNGAKGDSGSGSAEGARLFRNHVLGGAAIPEHWYGGGGDVNRATAAEMGTPTEKAMTAKQKVVRYTLEDVLHAQVEAGIHAGALREHPDLRSGVGITMPDLSPRDISRVATGLQQVAAALMVARGEGWVDDATGSKVMASLISHLGVEADADEMMEAAKKGLADDLAREHDRRLGVA